MSWSRRETRDIVSLRLDDVHDVCESLRSISEDLRKTGLGIQANKLVTIAEHLEEGTLLESDPGLRKPSDPELKIPADEEEPPQHPALHPVLLHLDAGPPWAVATPHNLRYLGARLTEAITLIEEMMQDAEITGSLRVFEKAKAWLTALGVRTKK